MSKKSKKKQRKEKRRSVAETAKRRAETHKSGFENTSFSLPDETSLFQIKGDKPVRLDIIPYEVGEGNPYADQGELHYERTYWVHRGVGADQTSYVCLSKTCGEKCPICEYRAKLMKDPDADEDLIRDLAPKERQLFNVIDTKNRDKGVQIWDMSHWLFGKKLDQEIRNSDEDDGFENFAELEGGFTLKCGVEEKSFGGNSFYEIVSINFKPRSEDYDDDILEKSHCLDELLIVKDYNELKEIFLQTADSDEPEEKSASNKDEKNDGDNDNQGERYEKGDRVTVEIEGEEYSGKITKINEEKEKATVKFDDGDIDEFDFDDLAPEKSDDNPDAAGTGEDNQDSKPEWNKGDRVVVEIEGEDYAGKIIKLTDEKATVKFDDGDIEKVSLDELSVEGEKADEDSSEDDGKTSSKKDKSKNKCPGGGVFGKDTDELSECDDCPLWDACDDA